MGCSGSKSQEATPLVIKEADYKIIEVTKETVDKILEEINLIDIQKIELDSDSQEYLETVGAYIYCFDRAAIQQVSKTGKPVQNIEELYEDAKIMLPVFEAKINGLLEQLTASGGPEESSGVELKLAPLKGMQRALKKAQDDYSKNEPGPAVSWLYDIDRGSLLFDKAELLFKFLELLRADESIFIVKSKNRFRNPTLSGYRDFNMQIQITNEEDGSKHICELQLHIKDIKELAIALKSHSYYEFFEGATDSLEERMGDLRAICKGGSLDKEFLTNVVKNPLDVDRMTRLADLFADYMDEYQLAVVITNAAKEIMEPHDWYYRFGTLFLRQGKAQEALAMHQTSLEIRLNTLGPEHAKVADSYNRIAGLLTCGGEMEKAMKLYKKVVDIRVKVLGPDHTDVAQTYHNMAALLQLDGKLEKAMELYEKVVDIRLKAKQYSDVAQTYNNMGELLRNQGKFEEAMVLYKKALDIRVKTFGSNHTNVASNYNNMANALDDQGKLEEAMELHRKALDIRVKALGPDDATVGETYYNMSSVLEHQGNLFEALLVLRKAVAIQEKALGPYHPSTQRSYQMIAYIQQQQRYS